MTSNFLKKFFAVGIVVMLFSTSHLALGFTQFENYLGTVDDDLGADTDSFRGQVFTAISNHDIAEIKLKLFKTGSVTTAFLDIYDTSSSLPTGSSLGQATVSGGSISAGTTAGDATIVTFTFSPAVTLLNANVYAFAISNSGAGSVKLAAVASGAYGGGDVVYSDNSGGSWSTLTGEDAYFDIYGDATGGGGGDPPLDLEAGITAMGLWGTIATTTQQLLTSNGLPLFQIVIGSMFAFFLLFFIIVGLSKPIKRLLKKSHY